MAILKRSRFTGFILVFAMWSWGASAEDFTNAIQAYLEQYVHAQLPHGCMVVGIVDEHRCSVFSAGDLDNGTDRQAQVGDFP